MYENYFDLPAILLGGFFFLSFFGYKLHFMFLMTLNKAVGQKCILLCQYFDWSNSIVHSNIFFVLKNFFRRGHLLDLLNLIESI